MLPILVVNDPKSKIPRTKVEIIRNSFGYVLRFSSIGRVNKWCQETAILDDPHSWDVVRKRAKNPYAKTNFWKTLNPIEQDGFDMIWHVINKNCISIKDQIKQFMTLSILHVVLGQLPFNFQITDSQHIITIDNTGAHFGNTSFLPSDLEKFKIKN